ncbi:hypothetical protein KIPB_005676 [Kipferlia bialata]|uniref:Intraflagellar transport protein 122 homolog TPR domain-containing protein n=1 Tax=Kipferlia bialata TaxID=797122 RepID=A0A9K3GHJ8_9EUKA|nr:hypothetical protein KIPB_005676 [Kipferlia bialata]|eukprot:g5676.t1
MKADFLVRLGEYNSAAEAYIQAGDSVAAVELLYKHLRMAELRRLAERLPKSEKRALTRCKEIFEIQSDFASATTVASRLGDVDATIGLLIRQGKWDAALALTNNNPGVSTLALRSYASWQLSEGHHREALDYFRKAGAVPEALELLRALIHSAVRSGKYAEAAAFYVSLSEEMTLLAKGKTGLVKRETLLCARGCRLRAALYQCQQTVARSVMGQRPSADEAKAIAGAAALILHVSDLPKAVTDVEVRISNAACDNKYAMLDDQGYLEHQTSASVSGGQRHQNSTVTLASLGMSALPQSVDEASAAVAFIGACLQLRSPGEARQISAKLAGLRIPRAMRRRADRVVLQAMMGPSTTESEDTQPETCPRCARPLPLLVASSGSAPLPEYTLGIPPCCLSGYDACPSCKLPLVRSPLSGRVIPVAEIRPETSVSIEEALRLILAPTMSVVGTDVEDGIDNEHKTEADTNRLVIVGTASEGEEDEDMIALDTAQYGVAPPVNAGRRLQARTGLDEGVLTRIALSTGMTGSGTNTEEVGN